MTRPVSRLPLGSIPAKGDPLGKTATGSSLRPTREQVTESPGNPGVSCERGIACLAIVVNEPDTAFRREVERRERGRRDSGKDGSWRPRPFVLICKCSRDVRAFVEKWGREAGLDEERRYRMKLAASEASANAIEHPQEKTDITVWAWHRGDRFTVDVWHAGQFIVRTGEDRSHRGMGLPLMLASVDEVAFSCLPDGGTRVSLSMFLDPATSPDVDGPPATPGEYEI